MALYINTIEPKPVPSNAWALYLDGYNAAIRGADLAECQTEQEREGWWAARATKGSRK